jgi:hypothetical protein
MGVLINGIEFTEKQLSEMSKAGLLNIGQKNDPSSSTPTASGVLQGQSFTNPNQYGIFSNPGVRPERFSALARPHTLGSMLRPQKSEYGNEIVSILTGQTAGTATAATDWCAPGALPGNLKACQQTYAFGNMKMATRIVPLQEVGLLRNRADIPGEILNRPPRENPFMPTRMYELTDTRSQLQYELFTLGVQIERSFETELWRGVAGTNTSIVGWWKDFAGLDSLVKTGYVDSVTGVACPAADSIVITWNADVGATVNSANIVQSFADQYYAVTDLAKRVGMEGVQFGFTMRSELFRALTEVWSCQYLTYRCQSSNAGQPIVISGEETNKLRLEMQRGEYLLIDGIPVPVVFSDGINLERLGSATPNVLRSDAYLLPISWNGRPLIRPEYHDMGNAFAREFAGMVYQSAEFLNDGMYLMTKNERGGCIELEISMKMRIFLETPFLAVRWDDISFSYGAQSRVADPGTTFLYKNGGVTYRS